MAANLLQIVDDIKSSPTVLLDLNNESPFGVAEFDAPPPPLRRTMSSSMLADGDRISASSYANRTLSLTFDQISASQDAMASSWQTLARLIDQDWYWLKYQPTGATSPVFFRCYRTDVPSIQQVRGATAYQIPSLQIPADPAAYGLAEDISSFTITNSPATGTNKMMVGPSVLGTIKGDLETPLLLGQTTGPGISVDQGSAIGYLSSYALGPPTGSPNTHTFLARSLSELTSGTDVGANVTGAGNNYIDGDYKSCSFATQTLAGRLSGAFSTALTPMPGTYRALMRVVAPSGIGSTSGAMHFTLQIRTDGSAFYTTVGTLDPTITWNNAADTSYLFDFGVIQFPVGAPTGAVGLATAPTTVPATSWAVSASQLGVIGSHAIRFDELFLLPVDTNYGTAKTALVDFPTYSATLPHNVIAYDGTQDMMRTLYDSSGTAPFAGLPATATAMSFIGGLPTVRPGFNNYLQFLYNATLTTGTTAFTGRYYPRYLYVRPAST